VSAIGQGGTETSVSSSQSISIDIQDVRRGDIVRFNSYSLRVEADPACQANSITPRGRISTEGCPLVTKQFIGKRIVTVERG